MWRNIFIESCVLSLLVFGGFYINANFLKDKISESEEKVRVQVQEGEASIHVSGASQSPPVDSVPGQHLSGRTTQPRKPGKTPKPLGAFPN